MTGFTDAALLTGDYAHMAAEMREGKRAAPAPKEWSEAACDNQAEEAAQEIAKQIFAFQQSIDKDKEQLEILTYSAAGQMRVVAIHPGDGDLLRIDGMLVPENRPASVVVHASLLSLTFLSSPLAKKEEMDDEGLQIGFVIFDELKERQKARYSKGRKKPKKIDVTKPFGLPKGTLKKPAPKKASTRKTATKRKKS